MRFRRRPRRATVASLAVLSLLGVQCGNPAPDAPPVVEEWPMYRGDLAGTGYSTLDEIAPDNVQNLSRRWTYSLSAAQAGPESPGPNSQATPNCARLR